MENGLSVDRGNANLALLAQAAAIEHALTPLQAMHKYWPAFLWCNFMCIGALLWGCNTQLLRLSDWQGTVTSIGSMLGGLSFGWISDRFGGRGAVAVASVTSIVSVLIQLLGMLFVGTLINGFALGVFVSCASGYSAEVSPLALRSIATASVNLWIVLGQFISNGIIWGTGTRIDVYAHRLPLALRWIFPVILLIGLPFAPESPWWLVRKGQHAAAERVLAQLGGPTIDVTFQRQQIQETLELEDSYNATSTYVDCFRGANLRRTVVVTMMFVIQQGTGMEFFSWFGTHALQLVEAPNSEIFKFAMGVTAIGVVGNLLLFWTVSRFGRQFLFHWGMAGCAFIMFLVAVFSNWITSQGPAKSAVLAFIIIFSFVYHTTIGPLGYVLFAEVSSAKLRSKTIGIGICMNSLCGMLTNIVISYSVTSDMPHLGMYLFGWLTLACRTWIVYFLPETKGRTVDELDMLYEKGVHGRCFGSHVLRR